MPVGVHGDLRWLWAVRRLSGPGPGSGRRTVSAGGGVQVLATAHYGGAGRSPGALAFARSHRRVVHVQRGASSRVWRLRGPDGVPTATRTSTGWFPRASASRAHRILAAAPRTPRTLCRRVLRARVERRRALRLTGAPGVGLGALSGLAARTPRRTIASSPPWICCASG